MSSTRLSPSDVLEVIERAYTLDASNQDWLRSLATIVNAHLGRGIGLAAFFYRVVEGPRVEVGEQVLLNLDRVPHFPIAGSVESLPPDFVAKSFVRCECTTQSAAMDAPMRAELAPMLEGMASTFGWRDAAMLGGMDPTGHGVYFGAWLPAETALSRRTRETWGRIAVHLASANRLRRALRADPSRQPEAVLTAEGRVEHAEGDAKQSAARDALRDAVRAIESARGPLRRKDPDAAVGSWRALASSRWSLVDQFEAGGRRYLVAHRNDAHVVGLDALTERERQAVAYAAMQQTNKLIAYEMGISASTVGVLLHRAAKKLGVGSREALIEAYLASRERRRES